MTHSFFPPVFAKSLYGTITDKADPESMQSRVSLGWETPESLVRKASTGDQERDQRMQEPPARDSLEITVGQIHL